MEQEQSTESKVERVVVDYLKAKLTRVRDKYLQPIIRVAKPNEEQQWAVRIIESRIRLFERIWQSKFGTGRAAEEATIELKIDKDTGDLFLFGGRKHRLGCFNCPACAKLFDENGLQKNLTTLCNRCGMGIEHVMFEEGKGESTEGETTSPSPLESQEDGFCTAIYQCESCHSERKETVQC